MYTQYKQGGCKGSCTGIRRFLSVVESRRSEYVDGQKGPPTLQHSPMFNTTLLIVSLTISLSIY